MRSIWDRLSRSPTQASTSQPQIPLQSQTPSKPLAIDYFELKQLWQKIHTLQSIDVLRFPEYKLSDTFEQMIRHLKQLLQIVTQLKLQKQANSKKIEQYDKLKSLVGKHSQIVRDIQQQSSNNLNRVYEQKRQLQHSFEQKIAYLQQQMQKKNKILSSLQSKLQSLELQNHNLLHSQSQLSQKMTKLHCELSSLTNKHNNLINLDQFSSNNQKIQYNIDHVNLESVFIFPKIRKALFSFMTGKEFIDFSLLNKNMYYVCQKSFKREFLGKMIGNFGSALSNMKMQVKDYERVIDSFPADNIRTNAIKYLYFKIKPGSYMLPYFQQDQAPQKPQQKSKLTQLSTFFRKKPQHQPQKPLNLELLKNDTQFKQIQKRVQTFFDKLFGIEAQQDLKLYNETMKKQLQELKMQLKGSQKSIQLLCMSRFLYIQVNQLNNLLQVCFAILVNKNQEVKDFKKKNNDLIENQRVLRNLVENIANDRENTEKRIFFLESQAVQTRNLEERLTQQVKKLKQIQKNITKQNEKLTNQLKDLKTDYQSQLTQQKIWQQNWQQAINLIKQIPMLQ